MTFSLWPAMVAGVFGAMVGSFLNVCIVRWPAGQSIVTPARSRCPRCGHEIRWYENIPVLSWLLLRGRCSACREPISVLYPTVELATALIWAGAFALAQAGHLLPAGSWLAAFRLAVFATVMLGVVMTDARHYVIPDGFTVFGLAFMLVTALAAAFAMDPGPFATFWPAILGACTGAGAMVITGWLGEVAFRKEAMGSGDATLMAVCGAALGPELVLLNVFAAATLGAIAFLGVVGPIGWMRARRAGREFEMPLVPFGVFLAPAAVVTLLWGDRVIAWYVSILAPV